MTCVFGYLYIKASIGIGADLSGISLIMYVEAIRIVN